MQAMEELIPIPMFKLYGDLSQEARRSTYLKFCEIPSGVLFCTDVAARGLDMPNISWIVQYDVPSDPKSYIHRVCVHIPYMTILTKFRLAVPLVLAKQATRCYFCCLLNVLTLIF